MQTCTYAGHTLTWEEHSTGAQTLIFLHGFSDSRRGWLPLIERLAPLGRCVSLDLPGHGLARPPARYCALTQDHLLTIMAHAVQQIAGRQPVTLIGHSTGGLVALGVASRLADSVARVVALNTVVWGPLIGMLGFAHWLLRHQMYRVFWGMWRVTQLSPIAMMYGLTFYVFQQRAHWRNPVTWRVCRDSYPWYRRQPLRHLAILLNLLEACDIRPLLCNLTLPVLAITGERDPVVPAEQSRWLAAHLPGAELHILPRVGHLAHFEAPAVCEQAIREWIVGR
jgi:pimeloyl-ACP methyl ester carboxylesterase